MTEGGRKRQVSDGEILEVFRGANDPVLDTAEVAEQLPIQRRGTLNRLSGLMDEGKLEGKDTGGRNRIWWLPEFRIAAERLHEGTAVPAEAPGQPPGSRPEEPDSEPSQAGESTESGETDLDRLIDEVADDVLSGKGQKLDDRREAFRAVVYYLRENGTAKPSDFKEEVCPEHPAHYASDRSWWKNAMYDGLAQLAERTDLIIPADTTGVWTWNGS